MTSNYAQTWETYASSWKAETAEEKAALFADCLDQNCRYHDPLTQTSGWSELSNYMLDFHKQIPGGHFVTTGFHHHSNKCIAIWDMCDGNQTVIGNGISYGEYNEEGGLASMTGFFDVPKD